MVPLEQPSKPTGPRCRGFCDHTLAGRGGSLVMKTLASRWVAEMVGASLFGIQAAWADNWPEWRGPAGTGVATEQNLPLHWSNNQNIHWRVPLPERGSSTPIVWDQRIFLTQAVNDRRTLMCF